MSAIVLVSPSASGKTRRCIEHIRRTLREQPMAGVWVVLPDRLQATAFRRRLALAGGAIGVHIGTFHDLFHSILNGAGEPIPVASESITSRFIRAAVRELLDEGGLTHYAPIADKPGLYRSLRERFAELKRTRVYPEVLLEKTESQRPALSELARLYAAYQEKLQRTGWADLEGVSWLAAEALERDPGLAANIRILVVDGFDSFTNAQLAVLVLLARVLPELVITLPGTPSMERTAHRRFSRSLGEIKKGLPEAEVRSLSSPPHLPTPLAHMERDIFEARAEREAGGRYVGFIEARTPVDEAREALRWMKARIIRDGLGLEECALVTPDPERYRQYLREAGAEFGLPLRFPYGESLASAPGIAALIDLLELPARGWPRRLTLEALRTPYLDLTSFDLTPQVADVLGLVSHFGQVIEGLEQWRDALLRLANLRELPTGELGENHDPRALPVGKRAETLWGSMRAFAERLAPPGPQPTWSWVHWLEDLLDGLHFFERQETQRDEASALGLREALRALILGEQVTGEDPVAYSLFLKELRSVLEGTNYQEQIVWGRPSIQVLRVLEARGLRFQAVAVLGLAEGLFPEVEREDPFLNEAIRAELGLEPRLEREQAGLFYQAVTRTDGFLLLTRPTMADDGERWEPSPYWSAAKSLFTSEPVIIKPDAPRALEEAASPEEVLFLAVRRGSLPASYSDLLPDFERLRHARQVLEARLVEDTESRFEGDLSAMGNTLEQLFGSNHHWSPSRLETYGTCPHFFFVAHTLKLEAIEPPEPGLDSWQLGLMLHAILENAYQRADDPTDSASVIAALEGVAAAQFEAAPEEFGFRPSPLWEVEQENLLERLVETVRGITELEEGWEPIAFEQVFGLDGEPPLKLKIDGQKVRLHGVIDRVDKDERGQLRVLDYKTGSSGLNPRELIDGRRLQLPLYALAARDALGIGEPVEGLYWAILAGNPGGLRLSRFKHEMGGRLYRGPAGAYQLAGEHVAQILAGVRSGAFRPTPPRGGCPSYCPAAAWCWRYVPTAW